MEEEIFCLSSLDLMVKKYTTPYGTYKENLKKYIQVARNAGAIPVLITSVERRCFVDAWKHVEETNLGNYAAGMRQEPWKLPNGL